MASGKGHIKGGILFFIIFMYTIFTYFTTPTLIDASIYFVLFIAGALFPDTDIKSIAQKSFYLMFFLFDVFLIFIGKIDIAAYFGVVIILPLLGKHRGWTHSIPAMFLIPSPFLLYPIYVSQSFDFSGGPYYACAVTGYFSHLVLDGKIKKF